MLQSLLRRIRSAPTASVGLTLSAAVTASRHADGVVFLHQHTGAVFTANATGGRMWDALRRGETPERIGAALAVEFGVAPEIVAGDAARFAAELESEGILVRSQAA
jgi:hypothetical protein